VSVAGLDGWKSGLEQGEVLGSAPARQAGKDVIGAEEEVLVGQPGEEGFKVVTAPLEFNVIALSDVVHADVQLGSAGYRAGHFFAEEEVGLGAQRLDGLDGIVIGDGDQVHAGALEGIVYGEGIVITFPTKAA
jgi:hypothetical protein